MAHECHHPYCKTHVPPRMLACSKHWFALPEELRNRIWRTYVPGQENRKDPSEAYLETMRDCIRCWKQMEEDRDTDLAMLRAALASTVLDDAERKALDLMFDGLRRLVFVRLTAKRRETLKKLCEKHQIVIGGTA